MLMGLPVDVAATCALVSSVLSIVGILFVRQRGWSSQPVKQPSMCLMRATRARPKWTTTAGSTIGASGTWVMRPRTAIYASASSSPPPLTSFQSLEETLASESSATAAPEVGAAKLEGETVYIEWTDAFAVVFHTRFLRFYSQVLQVAAARLPMAPPGEGGSPIPLPRLVRIDGLRYLAPATMGDVIDIEATPIEGAATVATDEENKCFWNSQTFEINVFKRDCQGDEGGQRKMINTAIVTCRWEYGATHHQQRVQDPTGRMGGVERGGDGGATHDGVDVRHMLDVRCWAEDIEGAGSLGLESAMRMMERARTTIIGGPKALARCSEEGFAIVVAKVDGLCVHGENRTGGSQGIVPGERLVVRSSVSGSRRVVKFHQEIIREGGETDEVLASGTVVCMCMDAGPDKRMLSFPDWCLSTVNQM